MTVGELERDRRRERFRDPGMCWQVGPLSVRVRTPSPWIADQLAFLYGPFPTLARETIVDVELGVEPRWPGRFAIFADGEVQYRRIPRAVAVPLVEWTLNVSAFQRPHQFFLLHAAVVEIDGFAAILPARAGQGKSTLCAALAHRGWRLLSDEVAAIRPEDGRVVPVPRPISLKEGSIELIRRFAPDARIGPIWPGTSKGAVAHVLPPLDSVRRAEEAAVPRWIVFPRWAPDAVPSLDPVPKARAAMRCADNAFNYSVLGRSGFETLANLVDRCECFDFGYGGLDDALHCLEGLRRAART